MGFVLSKVFWFWSPAGYDEPNPATGITPRQRDLVQSTWKSVRAETRKNGIRLFMKFFKTYPQYQKLFKAFEDVPLEDLPKNGKLLAHALNVMYSLNSVVDNLDEPECLVELLKKIGVNHQPRNLSATHFQNLAKVLLEFLKDTLGPNVMNETAEEAWRKTVDVAFSIIVKSMEGED